MTIADAKLTQEIIVCSNTYAKYERSEVADAKLTSEIHSLFCIHLSKYERCTVTEKQTRIWPPLFVSLGSR